MIGKEESIRTFNQKEIASLLSGKSFQNENFPVASFVIKRETKQLIRRFYFFARTADDIADNKNLTHKTKLEILNFFDYSIKKSFKSDILVLNNLIKDFSTLKFARNHSRNLLKAFKLDAKKQRYKDWKELLFYCKYSANPVGKFFIDLTYFFANKPLINKRIITKSSDNLCTALQIINHIQDCKDDYLELDRVYLPISLFKKYSIPVEELKNNNSSKDFNNLKKEMINKIEKLLDYSEKGLQLIDVWRLRKETLIILNIAKRLCFLLKNNDPLKKKIKLSRIELLFCFIKGIICD
jgi:squalene synthase HpnC